jgi:hypothetical protein
MTATPKSQISVDELITELKAIAVDRAERERMFIEGCVTIFEAIYGRVGPRLRIEIADRFERSLMRADTP